MNSSIFIRFATMDDAERILAIYAPYITDTAVTFEYDVPTLDDYRQRMADVQRRYPWLVAEIDGELVGFAYAGPFKERPAYDWSVETTIYVNQNKKRQGIGAKLYHALEVCLHEQGILNLNACIAFPEKNDEYLTNDSILFHENCGFRLVGQFHHCGYKFHRWYHMIWMEKIIGKHLENQPPVGPPGRKTCI